MRRKAGIGLFLIVAAFVVWRYPYFTSSEYQGSIYAVGRGIGYTIYSVLVSVPMALSGLVLLLSARSTSKPVVSALLLIVAAFITFNDFDPTVESFYVVFKVINIVVALLLFFMNTED